LSKSRNGRSRPDRRSGNDAIGIEGHPLREALGGKLPGDELPIVAGGILRIRYERSASRAAQPVAVVRSIFLIGLIKFAAWENEWRVYSWWRGIDYDYRSSA
jgi:hypothetical protein